MLLAALACGSPSLTRADQPVADPRAMAWPAYFGAPGEPGFSSLADFERGLPWTFAGLVFGGVELRDPDAPLVMPGPGIPEAHPPLVWYDSTATTLGEGAGWRGFGSALETAQGFTRPQGKKPRAVVTLSNGTNAIDRNTVVVQRGDERSWFRAGTTSEKRGGIGLLDLGGEHMWLLGGGIQRGAHSFEGHFAQQGMGELLDEGVVDGFDQGGLGESARGMGGSLAWRWKKGRDALSARIERGLDGRDSHGTDGDAYARRDSWRDAAEVTGERQVGAWRYSARVTSEQAQVVRWGEISAAPYARVQWHERSTWAALRARGPWFGGDLDLELGGGTHDAMPAGEGRHPLAPSASWHIAEGDARLRLYAERIVDPIWSDLRTDTPAFLQSVWAGGFEAGLVEDDGDGATLGLMAAQANDVANLLRYPIRDLALRAGVGLGEVREPLLLATAHAQRRWRGLGGDATGYALAAGRHPNVPNVDPSLGGRVGLESRFRLFVGDLGVRLRGEAAYVGERSADQVQGGFTGTLPAYTTFSGGVWLTLGDATIILRGEQLEGTRHPEVWTDPLSSPDSPQPALGPGRVLRVELIWPMYN